MPSLRTTCEAHCLHRAAEGLCKEASQTALISLQIFRVMQADAVNVLCTSAVNRPVIGVPDSSPPVLLKLPPNARTPRLFLCIG